MYRQTSLGDGVTSSIPSRTKVGFAVPTQVPLAAAGVIGIMGVVAAL